VAKNPYSVLGVSASAADSEIRAAFRKLAKQYHPDRNAGDKTAEERFKEISAAFDLLSDAGQRKRFDAGEIDADGKERGCNWKASMKRRFFPPATGSRSMAPRPPARPRWSGSGVF